MMSTQMINELSRRAAVKAARAHRAPLVVEELDVADGSVGSLLRGIPSFGDYRPKSWTLVPRADLKEPASLRAGRLDHLGCNEDYVFVDASGFGEEGEPALTFDEFIALASANPGLGWAIVEQGQFQVVIGAFRKNARKAG